MSDGFTHSKRYHANALKWTKENSRRILDRKLEMLEKHKSIIIAAQKCGVTTDYFVYSLRKHGYEQLVIDHDDRPRAEQRKVKGFKYDPNSEVLRHSQRANQRLANRVQALKKCKSIVKLAEQEGMNPRSMYFYFSYSGHQEIADKYDDR